MIKCMQRRERPALPFDLWVLFGREDWKNCLLTNAYLQGVNASQPANLSEAFSGQWVEVLDKQQGRHLGSSGMAFQ